VGQLALKTGADVEDVSGCIIWGNHSSTQYPDINSATIRGKENTYISRYSQESMIWM
jgi:malate/lactate dehydrogenase